MKTVWKYQLPPHPGLAVWVVDFEMPQDPVPLSAALQEVPSALAPSFPCCPTRLTIWAQVDDARPLRRRTFAVVGTGHEVPQPARFISTVQDGPFVWHVFDLGEVAS